MSVFKGNYHNGIVEMIEADDNMQSGEVYVLFPEREEKIKKTNAFMSFLKTNILFKKRKNINSELN
jgi:hypothetical protein